MKMTNIWNKEGIIFKPTNNGQNWMSSHGYIPTPYLINKDVIRIFVSFLDTYKVGRIGFIDVSVKNPKEILNISKSPILDIGEDGSFDDNGVTPISIIKVKEKIYLYYVGWQLSYKIRYFLFMGLAISQDNGESFQRISRVPILDRSNEESLIRTALTVVQDNGVFKGIYAGGDSTILLGDKIVPTYAFKYVESKDGIIWPTFGETILQPIKGKEFGFGRPFILKEEGIFKMWYSVRNINEGYRIGYAESADLKHWNRLDEKIKFISDEITLYDNQMMAFASVVRTKYGSYMFYNGNNYGEDGICFAKEL